MSPDELEGLVSGLDGLLELGVFEGGQNLLKFRPWCIPQIFEVVTRE